MKQKVIDVVLSMLASAAAVALSWPYHRNFEYFAESETAWNIYFILGFVVCVYIFFIFIHCVRTLFEHDRVIKENASKNGGNQ